MRFSNAPQSQIKVPVVPAQSLCRSNQQTPSPFSIMISSVWPVLVRAFSQHVNPSVAKAGVGSDGCVPTWLVDEWSPDSYTSGIMPVSRSGMSSCGLV